MVEFKLGAAAAAGLIGGGVMLVLLYGGMAVTPTRMRMNLLLMLGGMMGLTGMAAYATGLMMHAGTSVVFGSIHAAIFASADIDDAILPWGLPLWPGARCHHRYRAGHDAGDASIDPRGADGGAGRPRDAVGRSHRDGVRHAARDLRWCRGGALQRLQSISVQLTFNHLQSPSSPDRPRHPPRPGN